MTWNKPAIPNGVIKEYIISYGTSRDYQPREQTVTGKTMERVLDGLDKFITYFIKVRGKTSKMGNASKILNATTYEDSKYCVTVSGKIVLYVYKVECNLNISKLSPIISAPLSRRRLFSRATAINQAYGVVNTSPENAALFLWLGLPSTLISHENRACRKRSSNR